MSDIGEIIKNTPIIIARRPDQWENPIFENCWKCRSVKGECYKPCYKQKEFLAEYYRG